eukprot:CCRYP_000036-RA/>CCRYP_000036-RA protein AED:0.00 eAED:0.00 QI:224/-1/1/1/-1/1/1/41/319
MSINSHNDAIYDMSLSNKTILILCTIGFASLGIVVYFLILRHVPSTDDGEQPMQNYDEFLVQTDVAMLSRAERRARAKLRMKKARRVAVPAGRGGDDAHDDGALRQNFPNEDDNELLDGLIENNAANLSRKERQKAAKALEREERKIAAEMARVRREADQKTKNKKQTDHGEPDCQTDNRIATKLRLDDLFPQIEQSNDPMSDYLFRQSISEKYRDDPQRFLDDVIPLKLMTIRNFIDKLQRHGSVSLALLGDEFGITIKDVRHELDKLNKQYGILGLIDQKGNFVYVSREMITKATQMGREMGRISCHDDCSVAIVSQ